MICRWGVCVGRGAGGRFTQMNTRDVQLWKPCISCLCCRTHHSKQTGSHQDACKLPPGEKLSSHTSRHAVFCLPVTGDLKNGCEIILKCICQPRLSVQLARSVLALHSSLTSIARAISVNCIYLTHRESYPPAPIVILQMPRLCQWVA